MPEQIKLLKETSKGRLVKVPATIERDGDRIYFLKSPFALKDEIKAMKGSKWHQFVPDDGRKMWSVDDCTRNKFQLEFMMGGDPYANWDRPLQHWNYSRPLYDHQRLMADHCLTYHYKILAAEMGVGKTLSAIEVMENSGLHDWWWVGPKSALAAVEREFKKWGLKVMPRLMTYDRLRIEMGQWGGGTAPEGVIFDESSRLKSATANRTKAAMHLADSIREEHGDKGFVILMSGTPSPKSPVDWWAQCEVCYPGFLREGSAKSFERRMAVFESIETQSGKISKRKTWKDDENKCDVCGEYEDHPEHEFDDIFGDGGDHHFVPSKNEVAYLYERLDGLVLPLAKKDCLDIPDKIYRTVELEPTSTIKRVAKTLAKTAETAIQGITWLRELSDGFQYRERQEGMKICPVCKGEGKCEQWQYDDVLDPVKEMSTCETCGGSGDIPNMVRESKKVPCPKDKAIISLLDENEEQGRIVIFAGFQGSIDRVVDVCHKQQWDVVKVDGRGWKILPCGEETIPKSVKPLDYWGDTERRRVAFVAHPESGGMGLTLTESRMAVFYSNDYKPESRIQAEDRIHRPGIDENKGATIVDLFHLGTDRKVLNVLRDNRRLEQMTLGEVRESL
jgi:SNF2 family DNA or RNA helicase